VTQHTRWATQAAAAAKEQRLLSCVCILWRKAGGMRRAAAAAARAARAAAAAPARRAPAHSTSAAPPPPPPPPPQAAPPEAVPVPPLSRGVDASAQAASAFARHLQRSPHATADALAAALEPLHREALMVRDAGSAVPQTGNHNRNRTHTFCVALACRSRLLGTPRGAHARARRRTATLLRVCAPRVSAARPGRAVRCRCRYAPAENVLSLLSVRARRLR
jgi:hypothetical protein